MYGPTEATINATAAIDVDASVQPVSIGRPISNMQAHVLDAGLRLVVGTTGIPAAELGRLEKLAAAELPAIILASDFQ